MIEIGAGGGGIASVDRRGVIRVGPAARARIPGPACYGRSGMDATLTDANLVLGYLDAAFFLGGKMRLDIERAQRAIESSVGKTLDLPLPALRGVSTRQRTRMLRRPSACTRPNAASTIAAAAWSLSAAAAPSTRCGSPANSRSRR